MAANYVLLERIELNDTAASVTFSNIPQSGYTDLKLVCSIRNTASSAQSLGIKFNGSTTGYSDRWILGDGSAASSSSDTASPMAIAYDALAGNNTANTFSSVEIYIPNYTSSNYKSVSSDSVSENNGTTATASMFAGLWSNNAAINSIQLITYSGSNQNFAQYSTFSLYGLAAVGTTPVIAPKASGGNITTDGTYWYHTFLSTGTFTPAIAVNADVLVIAGGGSGGGSYGGGGGAGGVCYQTGRSVLATAYTVTVGAGGAANTTSSQGSNGTNTVFDTITALGGGGGGYWSTSSFAGSSGGSGGGSGMGASNGQTGAGGGAATQGSSGGATGYGNAGGNGYRAPSDSAYLGGGGGGAGGAGGNATTSATWTAGAGGAGLNTWSSWASATQTGVSGYYAGGGGGSADITGTVVGTGGSGGGGVGGGNGSGSRTAAGSGVANTGSGGGGQSGTSGAGGSGIVIIRYAMA